MNKNDRLLKNRHRFLAKIFNKPAAKKGEEIQYNPSIDTAELKHIISFYFNRVVRNGEIPNDHDNNEFLPISGAIPSYSDSIPSTGQSLQDKITWSQLHQEMLSIKAISSNLITFDVTGWYFHVIGCWVGCPQKDIADQLKTLSGSDEIQVPKITDLDKKEALGELKNRLIKYL